MQHAHRTHDGHGHRRWLAAALLVVLPLSACALDDRIGSMEQESVAIDPGEQGSIYANCTATAQDGYLHPLVRSVTLNLMAPDSNGIWHQVASTTRSTDATGYAYLSAVGYGSLSTHQVNCAFTGVGEEYPITPVSTYSSTSTSVRVDTLFSPQPTTSGTHYGLYGTPGTTRLYQSGAYDKVIVIAEPLNTGEQVHGERPPGELWMEYNGDPGRLGGWQNTILFRLYQQGYDVWIVQPNTTGENLHQQAAVFAQAIQRAVSYGGGATPRVITFGFSMGGLVEKVALLRWANDASFRSSLGLSATVPVSLAAFGDAPLRGANVAFDLQGALWGQGDEAANNLNSCSTHQMMQVACDHRCVPLKYPNDEGWNAFFNTGASFNIYQASGAITTCAGGPAVSSMTWPSYVKRVAWSQGTLSQSTGLCYGDSRDFNENGRDICPGVDYHAYGYGANMVEIVASNYPDMALEVTRVCGSHTCSDDIEPGSRQGTILSIPDSYHAWGFVHVQVNQILSLGTFIPSRSALDLPYAGAPSPMNATWTNTYNAVHQAITNSPGVDGQSAPDWLLGQLASAATSGSGTCGEASCVPVSGAKNGSHFTGLDCTGTESYYTPYDSGTSQPNPDGKIYSWDGAGVAGTILRTQTNRSFKNTSGVCTNYWQNGNTLPNFVTIYR